MSFYLSIAAVFFLCSFSFYEKNCRIVANPISFWLFALFLFLLAGFRYGIETDYWSYKNIFVLNGEGVEKGFAWLITVVKTYIADDFNVFVFFFALLSVLSKALFFSKLKNPFLALFLYFSLLYVMAEWNTIRQGFAISFLFFSLKYARERKIVPFGILIAFASLLHISSLLFIPMYFICNKRFSVKQIMQIVFAFLLFKIIFFDFIVVKLLAFLSQRVGNLFLQRLFIYLRGEKSSLITVGLIRRLFFLVLFILLHGRNKIFNMYFNAYLVGFFIYIFFMGNSVLSARLSMSFEAMMIPLFADLKIKGRWKNMYCVLFVCAISVALFYVSVSGGNAVPYRSYLFL